MEQTGRLSGFSVNFMEEKRQKTTFMIVFLQSGVFLQSDVCHAMAFPESRGVQGLCPL